MAQRYPKETVFTYFSGSTVSKYSAEYLICKRSTTFRFYHVYRHSHADEADGPPVPVTVRLQALYRRQKWISTHASCWSARAFNNIIVGRRSTAGDKWVSYIVLVDCCQRASGRVAANCSRHHSHSPLWSQQSTSFSFIRGSL